MIWHSGVHFGSHEEQKVSVAGATYLCIEMYLGRDVNRNWALNGSGK